MIKAVLPALLLSVFVFSACRKTESPNGPRLVFKYKFDTTQPRLNNLGQPAPMPAGHVGQNPSMNQMSAHYIELAPGALTQLGKGAVLYKAPETNAGGAAAIDFSKAVLAADGEEFFSVPLHDITPGDYEYLRVSLAYQNYDIQLYVDTTITSPAGSVHIAQDFPCTVASFVGFNTYITNYAVKSRTIAVNGNRAQGYWGFESKGTYLGYDYNFLSSGQAPAGATTVVNPIASTSPIPAGSCVVTGPFSGGKLHISGTETSDIVVIVSLSTNQSFEWIDGNANGKWEPGKGEKIVDMGLRGMVPTVQ